MAVKTMPLTRRNPIDSGCLLPYATDRIGAASRTSTRLFLFLFRFALPFFALQRLFAGKDQVQKEGDQEDDGDAVFREDRLNQGRENLEDGRGLRETDADGQGQGGDAHVAGRKAAVAEHADAADDDGAEHHEGAAVKDRVGQRGQNDAQGGNQASQDHEDGAARDGLPVDDVRHGHESHVLAERGDGQAAEQGRQGADEPVYGNGAGHFLIPHEASHAHDGQGRRVAQRFRGRHEENQEHGKNSVRPEFHRVRQEMRQGEEAGGPDFAQVDHAEKVGRHVPGDEAEEDRQLFVEPVGADVEHQAGYQGEGADNQVFRLAEVGIPEPAAEGIGADAEQGEADGRHDAGRHDGRHKTAPPPRAQAQHPFQAAADEGGAQDGAVPVLDADDAERGHESETDAHDDRQPAAQGPDGKHLQQGPDTGDNHGRLDETACLFRPQMHHAALDDTIGQNLLLQ